MRRVRVVPIDGQMRARLICLFLFCLRREKEEKRKARHSKLQAGSRVNKMG